MSAPTQADRQAQRDVAALITATLIRDYRAAGALVNSLTRTERDFALVAAVGELASQIEAAAEADGTSVDDIMCAYREAIEQ